MSLYNSARYFTETLLDEHGFREYDVRWIVEPVGGGDTVQLNYRGAQCLGYWLGTFLQQQENGGHRRVLVGHDFRRYSEHVKNALALGLLASGTDVTDAGLTISPGVYFGQYAYGIPACAMVTASHNPNGWTGVKIGHGYSRTFEPAEMSRFRQLIHEHAGDRRLQTTGTPGSYTQVTDLNARFSDDLLSQWRPRLSGAAGVRVAIETGNGTAGILIVPILRELGFDLACGHVEPDWEFPHFNPNPESVPFLRAVQTLVRRHRADIGLCLDGDGDRVGLVDDRGRIVFSDRAGLLIARHLEDRLAPGAPPSRIVVDVKSTSLFNRELSSTVVWEKTGHSYIKSAVRREQALAGFERSGHFFFSPPYGRGYDDACLSSLMLLWLVCRAKEEGRALSSMLDSLPPSHPSPNRQPAVPEARKYEIVAEIRRRLEAVVAAEGSFAGLEVKDPPLTINGIRINTVDGSWVLVRASSNTPNLVIMAETFDEDGSALVRIDRALRDLIADIPDIGDFESLKADL